MRRAASLLSAAVVAAGACTASVDPAPVCETPIRIGSLPADLRESSGLAASVRHDGIFWTHNDSGGESAVFAIDSTGAVRDRVEVTGAENRDWEDIARGPCPSGECLYIGEIGDNREVRDDIAIYRVPEPAPGDSATAPAERFPIRYPDGPQDAEALFVLPSETVLIVTKGRSAPPTLYRYPAPLRPDEAVELERVQTLADSAPTLSAQVTGASAAPDGRWIAVRTYARLRMYRVTENGGLGEKAAHPIPLQSLGEPQGEAVALGDDGTVFLTSEAESAGEGGPIARTVCELR